MIARRPSVAVVSLRQAQANAARDQKPQPELLDRGPDTMHIIMLFERLKKFSSLGTMFVA